jgi:hypothetical protein
MYGKRDRNIRSLFRIGGLRLVATPTHIYFMSKNKKIQSHHLFLNIFR